MGGRQVRWICKTAHLHRGTSFESLDAFCDPLAVCAALGIAEDQTGHQSSHDAVISRSASERKGQARSAGVGCACVAQRHLARCADCCEADARSGALRFQLALGHRNWMLLRGNRLRIVAWARSAEVDEDLLENAGADAARHDCDLIHARPGVRDTLLGTGRGARPGVHAYWMDVSILRHIPGMAGSCAYRK